MVPMDVPCVEAGGPTKTLMGPCPILSKASLKHIGSSLIPTSAISCAMSGTSVAMNDWLGRKTIYLLATSFEK